MAQSISQEAIGATGLPGATAASRHAGATTSGAPTTGTFAVGDYVVDQSGAMWVCTVAGTPGTWVALRNATALQGVNVSSTAPTSNQVLSYNSGTTSWTPTTPSTTLTYLSQAYGNGTLTNNSFPGPAGTVTNAFTTASLAVGTWLMTFSGGVQPNAVSGIGCEVYVAAGTATCSFSGSYNTGLGSSPASPGGGASLSLSFTLSFITTVTTAGTLILKIYNPTSSTFYATIYGSVTGQFWGYTAVKIA